MKSNSHADKGPTSRSDDAKWDREVAKLIVSGPVRAWRDPAYPVWRIASRGLLLGAIAGCTSLVANVIGSVIWPSVAGEPQHPLRLIQVYLTFPLGESALRLDHGILLGLGCLLYLGVGMLYGVLFEVVISYFVPRATLIGRLAVCTALSLLVWIVNFYGILVWLQPLLFGGQWIFDLVPWWVAAGTHLIFGWTMALVYPLGVSR